LYPGIEVAVALSRSPELWEFISPFLPVGEYGPYPENLRAHFEGVVWRFRNGAKWRELPERFGHWSTVYGRFRQWRDAGVFTAVFQGAIAERRSGAWWTCRWSAWTRPQSGPIMMLPG
jgi:transposase